MSRRIVIAITTCLIVAAGLLVGLSGPSAASTPMAHPSSRTGHVWVAVSAGGCAHLRDPPRPHPVVLGIQRRGPARARRHHRPAHPRPRSAPTPTGRTSAPARMPHLRRSAPTTPCGAGETTTTASSGSATPPTRLDPDPGRHRHRLGTHQRRRLAHLRDPHRPHPVVLGIEQLRPARARRHHRPAHPHPGRHRHRLGARQRRRLPHLRDPHRPHPVVLGIQRLRPARARRHHRPAHPHPGRHRHQLGTRQRRRLPHLRDPHRPHPVVLGRQRLRPARARRHHRPDSPPPRSAPTPTGHTSAPAGTTPARTRTDHTLWCWGYNARRPARARRHHRPDTAPTQVGTDTNWAHVTAGWHHTCGTRTDHTLWCWGSNDYGQLGLGDTTDRWCPRGSRRPRSRGQRQRACVRSRSVSSCSRRYSRTPSRCRTNGTNPCLRAGPAADETRRAGRRLHGCRASSCRGRRRAGASRRPRRPGARPRRVTASGARSGRRARSAGQPGPSGARSTSSSRGSGPPPRG